MAKTYKVEITSHFITYTKKEMQILLEKAFKNISSYKGHDFDIKVK